MYQTEDTICVGVRVCGGGRWEVREKNGEFQQVKAWHVQKASVNCIEDFRFDPN